MMTKIEIITDNSVTPTVLVEDIFGNNLQPDATHEYNLQHDWHCIKIPYEGTRLEFTDIKLNGNSIEHLIYTGYFHSDLDNKKHQPATAVWETGKFILWFHPKLGVWQKTLYEQIENGMFGKNLFEKYSLTVDRPVTIDDNFPENIKTFFAHSFGPVWWKKDSVKFPYRQLDIDVDEQTIKAVQELESKLPHNKTVNGWIDHMSETPTDDADPRPLKDIGNILVEKLLDNAGYSHYLSYSVMTLNPGRHINIHIDDHVKCKNIDYVKGCQKFYLAYGDLDGVYFKLGSAGILPFDKPLLINTTQHTHSVVNQTANARKVFMCYGVLKSYGLKT